MVPPELLLGGFRPANGRGPSRPFRLPAHHLVTHGVIVGMTGSGKTGLLMGTMEEALRSSIPVLAIDVKGDLTNLVLAFPTTSSAPFEPWVLGAAAPDDSRSAAELAAELASARAHGLEEAGIGATELEAFVRNVDVRVLTPGSTAGEPIHMLSSLERRSSLWDSDVESARAALSAAVSLVLRLVGRDADPARSKEHVLLSVLAERRLSGGTPADLATLIGDLDQPPVDRIGALRVDAFVGKAERRSLAAALNNLLASPTFAAWREGTSLDIGAWLTGTGGRTAATIVSVSHLDDEERALVLGLLFEELLAWVRAQPGSTRLRALVAFDEVFGFLPPHPANPPTKRPIVALMKQARAFGVGLLLATQNPMDVDYRALSNAGFWAVGRLQTDADRARIVDGLGLGANGERFGGLITRLAPRWFVVRDVRAKEPFLLRPRTTISYLRGPLTRSELARALRGR